MDVTTFIKEQRIVLKNENTFESTSLLKKQGNTVKVDKIIENDEYNDFFQQLKDNAHNFKNNSYINIIDTDGDIYKVIFIDGKAYYITALLQFDTDERKGL